MDHYKVQYTYMDYYGNIHGKRIREHDTFQAESAQDAVNQCRQEFYAENELDIKEVAKWSPYGYWLPVLDSAWI